MAAEPVSFVAAMIDEGKSAADWVSHGALEPLFITKWEKGLYAFISDYIADYGKLPPKSILQQKFDDPFTAQADAKYYHEKMRVRFVEHSIRSASAEADVLLKNDEAYDPDKALALLRDRLIRTDLTTNQTLVLDSRHAMLEVWEKYQAKLKLTNAEKGLLLGWPSIDNASGGIGGGEVVSIVGRPATGKSWFMLWLAMNGWAQKRQPVFVTLEMSAEQIIERQIGIAAGVEYGPIKSKTPMPKVSFDKAVATVHHYHEKIKRPFYVVDGRMASSMSEIIGITRAVGGNVIYIDGAYLLRHPDARLDRYKRVAENMDLIKIAAMRLDIPIVCSWQFNRDAAKKMAKKDAQPPDLEDIGYSDAIPQHSSIVLGLLQPESLATILTRLVYVLKGRGGEQGQFKVAWDFLHSYFGETTATVEDNAIFI